MRRPATCLALAVLAVLAVLAALAGVGQALHQSMERFNVESAHCYDVMQEHNTYGKRRSEARRVKLDPTNA